MALLIKSTKRSLSKNNTIDIKVLLKGDLKYIAALFKDIVK